MIDKDKLNLVKDRFRLKDNEIIDIDFKQMEEKLVACGGNDVNFDIYKKTYAELFDINESDVTEEQRKFAKSILYGLLLYNGQKE